MVVVLLGGTVVGGVLIGKVVEVVGGDCVVVVGGLRCTGVVVVVGFRCVGMVEVVVGRVVVLVEGVGVLGGFRDGMTMVRNPPEPIRVCSAGGGKPSTHPLSPLVGGVDALPAAAPDWTIPWRHWCPPGGRSALHR